ncbi:MAG: cytochrome c oxidase accessory protein CcoG [Gammaproteobacteria bacterium]|nr:cytochrome c oxidase accessory protein CcoG [Gammaproteobacteria bacterium]
MSGNQSQPADISESLYQKQKKIYPRQVSGLFAMWRTIAAVTLLGIYYGVPWLQWGDRQAVLLDLPERKFYIFGMTFWPQDFFWFAMILAIAAFTLFFFTTLAGRLWCGYACPQTVWTEAFLWIERKIEGDRSKQMKLDKSPWNLQKIRIKAAKHFVWIVFAAYTGVTFVGYFTPITGMWGKITAFELGPWETFWVFFYSFATWGNAGFMREQVCMFMCPYARFQSAMFDKDTLVISYDKARGEPRGSRKRGSDYKEKGLGDCIDCTMCVQVCPTGIDIRRGLQANCIACAACIDVCDDVMDKVGYSKGLIRYTTENALEGKPVHILRPRVFVYASLLIAIMSGVVWGISTRIPLELDVIRDRNTLYRETMEGLIENVYTLKILNMDEVEHEYDLAVSGIEGMKMTLTRDRILIPAGEVAELPLWLRVDPYDLKKRSTMIKFHLTARDNPRLTAVEEGRFLGPTNSGR